MQLTMEPLEEMLESARVMDEAGLDTIWLAEAYPWWRKHGMEGPTGRISSGSICARSSSGVGRALDVRTLLARYMPAISRAAGHGPHRGRWRGSRPPRSADVDRDGSRPPSRPRLRTLPSV